MRHFGFVRSPVARVSAVFAEHTRIVRANGDTSRAADLAPGYRQLQRVAVAWRQPRRTSSR